MRRALLVLLLAVVPAGAQEEKAPPKEVPARDKAPPKEEPAKDGVPPEALQGVEQKALAAPVRFVAGTTRTYRLRERMELRNGPWGSMLLEMGLTLEQRVDAVGADGEAKLIDTIKEVLVEQGAADATRTLDTRDGTRSGEPALDAMAELVGGQLVLRVAKDGKILGCAGAAALVDRVLAAVPEGMQESVRFGLEQQLGEDVLIQRLQDGMVVLPEGELQPGHTWRRSSRQPVTGFGVFTLEVEQESVYLGQVVKDDVRCAKLLVRERCKGCKDQMFFELGPTARISVDPFEARTAIYVRVDDGALVAFEPLTLEYRMTLDDPDSQEHHDMGVKSITRWDLVPPKVEPKPAEPKAPAEPTAPGTEPAPPSPRQF